MTTARRASRIACPPLRWIVVGALAIVSLGLVVTGFLASTQDKPADPVNFEVTVSNPLDRDIQKADSREDVILNYGNGPGFLGTDCPSEGSFSPGEEYVCNVTYDMAYNAFTEFWPPIFIGVGVALFLGAAVGLYVASEEVLSDAQRQDEKNKIVKNARDAGILAQDCGFIHVKGDGSADCQRWHA